MPFIRYRISGQSPQLGNAIKAANVSLPIADLLGAALKSPTEEEASLYPQVLSAAPDEYRVRHMLSELSRRRVRDNGRDSRSRELAFVAFITLRSMNGGPVPIEIEHSNSGGDWALGDAQGNANGISTLGQYVDFLAKVTPIRPDVAEFARGLVEGVWRPVEDPKEFNSRLRDTRKLIEGTSGPPKDQERSSTQAAPRKTSFQSALRRGEPVHVGKCRSCERLWSDQHFKTSMEGMGLGRHRSRVDRWLREDIATGTEHPFTLTQGKKPRKQAFECAFRLWTLRHSPHP